LKTVYMFIHRCVKQRLKGICVMYKLLLVIATSQQKNVRKVEPSVKDSCLVFTSDKKISFVHQYILRNQSNSSMHHYDCVALCKDISLQCREANFAPDL